MKIRIFCILLILPFTIQAQQAMLDSLENLLPHTKGAEKVTLLNELCWQYGPSDIKKSEIYGRQALSLSLQFRDSSLIAEAYNYLGIVSYRNSDYDSAIILYKKALDIGIRNGIDKLVARLNSKIGTVYQELGTFDLAVKYQLKAIRFFEENQDSIKMSQGYTNLARVYYENHEYKKSISYNNKALIIFERYNYTYGKATSYGSLALNFQQTGDEEKAISYLEKALNLFKKLNDKSNIATVLLNLGQLNRKLGNTQKGIEYYEEVIQITNQLNDPHTYAMTAANLANIYVETGNTEKAKDLYIEALKIAKEIKVLKVEHQCYRGLSNLYNKTGSLKDALYYKTLQYNARDSLYNIEKYEQLSELETKYETQKKEQEIELWKVENKLKQSTIKRQEIIIIGTVVGVILLFIILLLWYNRKRLQQKAALEAEKNLYRKKLLDASIEVQEKERKRIARELHDGVAQQLGGLKMAWQSISKEYKGKSQERLKEITKTLDETTDEVRNISHQMMPRVLNTSGLIYAIEDMLNKTFKYTTIKYRFEHFGIEGRFNEKIELSLYRVCQELINNVIKHSGANFVSIQLLKSKKYLVLMLEDNGKGMKSHNKKPGIGLLNIASRIDTINGVVNYEPGSDSGTVATVRIPLEVADDVDK